jgi:RNA polymerase sigma-70 factor (ECF subfamily)
VDSDESIFDRVKQGEMDAFDCLYERYEVRLFSYLIALLGDRRDAEEVFHDAFLNTVETQRSFSEAGEFRAYLFRVARNLAFNRRRAAGRRARAHASADSDVAGAPSAENLLQTRELETALDEAVKRLPEAQLELYHLRVSGLSYEQISSVVSVPLGTVKSRMHQMVHALREELKPWIVPD